MNDDELERIAARLGRRAADRLVIDRVAGRVMERLRAEPARRTQAGHPLSLWLRAPLVLRLAAVLAVLLTGGILARHALEREPTVASGTQAMVATASLRDLTADELSEVLDSLSVEQPVHEAAVVGLYELSPAELQVLLRQMEG